MSYDKSYVLAVFDTNNQTWYARVVNETVHVGDTLDVTLLTQSLSSAELGFGNYQHVGSANSEKVMIGALRKAPNVVIVGQIRDSRGIVQAVPKE
ncbi:MAG TPA: hypothetical protein VLI92_03565 [Candidatus Saccharimonadales bacterium]|nr:hypothetical protein [Candidatus Saccharimonadales bacterium]